MMDTARPLIVTRRAEMLVALILLFVLLPSESLAQLEVSWSHDEIVVEYDNGAAQRIARLDAGRNGSGWYVFDTAGRTYPAFRPTASASGLQVGFEGQKALESGNYQAPSGDTNETGREGGTIIIGGYQAVSGETTETGSEGASSGGPGGGYQGISGDTNETGSSGSGGIGGGYQETNETGAGNGSVLGGGYQATLDILTEEGFTVVADEVLGLHIVSRPAHEDPIGSFFEIVTERSIDGKPLYHYIAFLEVANEGSFDLEIAEAELPEDRIDVPNDTHFPHQWNLLQARLLQAQWHPARAKKPVTIGVIDSGIPALAAGHAGLAEAEMTHKWIAPQYDGLPFAHAVGVMSLLADAGNDGDGIVGLLGSNWSGQTCVGSDPLLGRGKSKLISYGVGAFGPNSLYVARAIYAAIEDKVDVINLSLALGYSPLVEDAIKKAIKRRIVVVAAAGNAAGDSDTSVMFPASVPGVISVGAVDQNGDVASFSATLDVDIWAGGDGVITGGHYPEGWYWSWGTSYAAPHVTATVAMMKAVNRSLQPAQIEEILAATALRTGEHSVLRGGISGRGSGGKGSVPIAKRVKDTVGNDKSENASGVPGHEGVDRPETVPIVDALAALNAVLPGPHREWDPITPLDCARRGGKTLAEHVVHEEIAELPLETRIEGNYPNPFNPTTSVSYSLSVAQPVRISVHNALGREVRVLVDREEVEGQHQVRFDATGLPSGVYFVRMNTESNTFTHKMLLLK